MDSEITQASQGIPFLRHCKKETDIPIEGELKGEIPKWLEGTLIRVGTGRLEVGPDHYNHLFDGLALMHKFSFKDGKVTYRNRFLRSDTFRKNTAANRIVVNEFGTPASPDPCKTIFQRFSSLFNIEEMTDNDLVNIILYANEPYACSETNFIWKIDPETLEGIEKVKLSSTLPVNAAIAHAHEDRDGTVYNVGSVYNHRPQYKLFKVPPKGSKDDNSFKNASVVCSVPSSRMFSIGYHHSFGMSENYFVIVEQPCYLSMAKFISVHFFGGGAYSDALHWEGNEPSRFHVIRRSDGKLLDTVYIAKSFFVFHHINAYEEDDHLVVDMCAYDDGKIVNDLFVKALEDLFKNKKTFKFGSSARRYVLPLNINGSDNDNLVKLSNTKASAQKLANGSVFCSPELLTDTDSWQPELPRINYERCNGRKYKYYYAMAKTDKTTEAHLIKVNVETKALVSWNEEGTMPSEPVFISKPGDESKDEDSGVLVASLLYINDESKVSMVVLSAETMQEIGRVTFHTISSVPADFHGVFIANKKL